MLSKKLGKVEFFNDGISQNHGDVMSRPKGFKLTEEHKRKIGVSRYRGGRNYHSCVDCGVRIVNNDALRCRSCSKKGKHHPMYGVYGQDNPSFTGKSIRSERQLEMQRIMYKNWRNSIFERDKYTCVHCHEVGGRLNAHHIISWKSCENSRYDINNGVTLCENCHREVHYGK